MGDALTKRLDHLVDQCGDQDWDGNRSEPFTRETADAFLNLLAGSVFPSVNGHVAVEIDLPHGGTLMFDVRSDGVLDGVYSKPPSEGVKVDASDGELEWEWA